MGDNRNARRIASRRNVTQGLLSRPTIFSRFEGLPLTGLHSSLVLRDDGDGWRSADRALRERNPVEE
jgi:hypothetical protein